MRHIHATALTDLRTSLRNRRAERCAHRVLRQELASYTSPSDQAELIAILGRSDDPETTRVRELATAVRSQARG